MSIFALSSLGRIFAPANVGRTITVRLFDAPVSSDTPVTLTSSNPSVAAVNAIGIVPAGRQDVTVDLVTGPTGTATVTLESGGVRRELTVVAGDPPTPGTTPPVVAPPAGITVLPNPSIGRLFGAPGSTTIATLSVPILATPSAAATTVTITSSNTAVALVEGGSSTTVTVAPGEQTLLLALATTGTEGAALITFEFDGERREVLVVVGNPPASQIPAVTAPAVGIRIGG